MEAIGLDDLEVRGELAVRALLNYARLEGKWYRPDEVFTADQHGWPADWEGRLILALTLHGRASRRAPAYLEELLARIPGHVNAKGYFGAICPAGVANEQQLAGHSWLLRGLIEYYRWKKNPAVLRRIKVIVKTLLLPARENYRQYPLTLEAMIEAKGWQLSHPQSKTKSHAKSIDTGCGFIMLDGASAVYEFTRSGAVKELLEVMIERFKHVDLEGMNVQTHATLAALRGILRYCDVTGDHAHLDFVETIFTAYKTRAMTEHYGNYNWWGRPRWTEPCAIIDSFIIANWLWKLTGKTAYLEDAHHIFYNAATHAQRAAGSFGTDFCLGADLAPHEPETEYNALFARPRTYEVYWCCTMRAGELFGRAIDSLFLRDGNTLVLPHYHECTATVRFDDGAVVLKESTAYPYEGTVNLKVLKSAAPAAARTLKVFLPSWRKVEAPALLKNGETLPSRIEGGFLVAETPLAKGDELSLDFGIRFHVMDKINPDNTVGAYTFRHGPMILAVDQDAEGEPPAVLPNPITLSQDAEFDYIGKGSWRLKGGDVVLSPLYRIDRLARPWSCRQALFG